MTERGAAAAAGAGAPPSPTKPGLKTWWNQITAPQRPRKDGEDPKEADTHPSTVFGKPLRESMRFASVQIKTANARGEIYVWGYIPVVVAKCGMYLKRNATEIEGVFRVNGSNRRMRELQIVFETPPRYGKNLDWNQETYTAHDVASVFRRYLTQMPEPVIPYDLYSSFRDALAKKPHNQAAVIAAYKRLISSMPRRNQYLLLYVLDLLSVFARKADKNLMTAQNLAVIFRPGLISHPNHELSPQEHQLSQHVLEFLIEHQDWFMLETPAPPLSEPGTPVSPKGEELSSDENDSLVGGGWRLVKPPEKEKPRRRATVDTTPAETVAAKKQEAGGSLSWPLSPVGEAEGAGRASGSVTRRRTLPTSTPLTGRSQDGGARVLRKPRRASQQPAKGSSG